MCEFEVKKGSLKKDTGNGGHAVIPDGVTTVVKGAFKGRTDLQSIVFPEGFTTIPSEAFAGCTNLTSVVLPKSIESIGFRAFYKTPWLAGLGDWAVAHGMLLVYQGRKKQVTGTSISLKRTAAIRLQRNNGREIVGENHAWQRRLSAQG